MFFDETSGPTEPRIEQRTQPTAGRVTELHRHLAWLTIRHQQSAGAARNLRTAANAQDSALVADQKRKAADNAAINAAHYHEIRTMLEEVQRYRSVLMAELATAAQLYGPPRVQQARDTAYARFVATLDRVFGFARGGGR